MNTSDSGDGITATLENWRAYSFSEDITQVVGDIHGDTEQRWPDGTVIRTSKVVSGEFKEGEIIKTLNSTYLLGNKGVQDG